MRVEREGSACVGVCVHARVCVCVCGTARALEALVAPRAGVLQLDLSGFRREFSERCRSTGLLVPQHQAFSTPPWGSAQTRIQIAIHKHQFVRRVRHIRVHHATAYRCPVAAKFRSVISGFCFASSFTKQQLVSKLSLEVVMVQVLLELFFLHFDMYLFSVREIAQSVAVKHEASQNPEC